MMSPVWILSLLIAGLGFSVAAQASSQIRFEVGAPEGCYTEQVSSAVEALKAGSFPGAGYIKFDSSGIVLAGQEIHLTYDYYEHRGLKAVLKPCAYNNDEKNQNLDCEVTVQSEADEVPPAQVPVAESYYAKLDAEIKARKLKIRPFIDCKQAKVRVLRNTWRQPVSVAQYKLLRSWASKGIPFKPKTSSASLFEGGSLSPEVARLNNWSAEMAFEFEISGATPEVLDAHVTQFTVPAELKRWIRLNGNVWTPWSLQVVSMKKCVDPRTKKTYPDLVSPSVIREVPFDLNEPTNRSYCASIR